MPVMDLIKKNRNYREISPGEFAGPCPTCGGALRLRIWPDQDRFRCNHCALEGNTTDLCNVLAPQSPTATSAQVSPAPDPHSPVPVPGFCCRITTPDNLDYWVTDKREEWERLSGEGAIVFSAGEIQRISRMVNLAGDRAGKVAEMHLAAKRIFPGTYVSTVEDLRSTKG